MSIVLADIFPPFHCGVSTRPLIGRKAFFHNRIKTQSSCIFPFRLVTTDEDNKRLKIEMSELRAKHRLEVERINNAKEQEMEEVHKR